MLKSYVQSLFADPDGTPALVRRLMVEQASRQWKRYVAALGLMAIAAGSTALGAYLVGDVINQAYVHKNFYGILTIGLLTAFIFMVKASATYLQAVKLSKIGNAIIADNQRAMFDVLVHQNLEFFAGRHSTDILARLTAGAAAASTTINLIVGAIGRDFLVLVALLIVMIVQDPVMSFFSFIVVPPALYLLRKMIRRISNIAKRQFTGGARILETMQETVQGIRIVKAYTMEDAMRARLAADVADLERESNRWARTAHRAGPLMEAMGGFAIAFAMIYGGFRVLETGATPGQFFSFLAAFMLAYEPAKRLARLNIDLNTALVGVRILFGILDAPPTERAEDSRAAAQARERAGRIRQRPVRLPAGRNRHSGPELRGRARQDDRAGRPLGRRQVDDPQPDPAFLRDRRRRDRRSTGRTSRRCRCIRCAIRSPMSGRTCSCSTPRCATTSRSAGPTRPKRRSSPPPRPRTRMTSS